MSNRCYKRNVVIDFEWTQIPKDSPAREYLSAEIIQIGAVLLNENYVEIGRFTTFVRPEYAQKIKKSVTDLTGIRMEDLANAPKLEDALNALTAWIGDGKTRIFSWSRSDEYQLDDECFVKDIAFPHAMRRWVDLQRVYGYIIGYRYSQVSLKHAINSFNIQFEGRAHAALNDAVAAANILTVLTSKEGSAQKASTVRNLFSPPKQFNTIGDQYSVQLAKLLA